MKTKTVKILMSDALLTSVYQTCDAIIHNATRRQDYEQARRAALVALEVQKAMMSRDYYENIEISRKAYDWLMGKVYLYGCNSAKKEA